MKIHSLRNIDVNSNMFVLKIFSFIILIIFGDAAFRRRTENFKCPTVRSSKFINFEQMVGDWYVIEYYANSEEFDIYSCMRTTFYLSPTDVEMTMNFTFSYIDDPDKEKLYGNITWRIPDLKQPSHWVHSEKTYEGIYNTYILDMDVNGDKSWVLLLHCAEKSGSARYLSSFILSRRSTLPINVISFLRDKLPRYDVDLHYSFRMQQDDCATAPVPLYYQTIKNTVKTQSKNPFKHPNHHN